MQNRHIKKLDKSRHLEYIVFRQSELGKVNKVWIEARNAR